jgi:hypothetical protein
MIEQLYSDSKDDILRGSIPVLEMNKLQQERLVVAVCRLG